VLPKGRLDTVPNRLPTELNVCGVVSCNEEFERSVTLSTTEWEKIGVQLFKVNVADFNFAPENDQLIAAADFINKYVQGRSKLHQRLAFFLK